MTTAEARQKLSEITKVLLSKEVDFLALKNSIEDYKTLLLSLSKLDYNDRSNQENILTLAGEAIGPKWAGMCLEDMARTRAFVCGICKAVEGRKREKKGKPVVILYTGTGPFATLILPLLTLYGPEEVQFLLLEINPVSVASLRKVISGLDADAYVMGLCEVDALSFEIPNPSQIDVVIIECLQRALAKEPQVALSYHLVRQLNANAILIPEEISLHPALINWGAMMKGMQLSREKRPLEYCQNLDAVFILNKKTVQGKTRDEEKVLPDFDEKLTLFDKEQLTEDTSIAITTEITVYTDYKLTLNESGLTVPMFLISKQPDKGLKGLKTKYVVNESPTLQVTIVR